MPDNTLAALMARQGAESIRNPVNRFLLHLPSSSPVAGVVGQRLSPRVKTQPQQTQQQAKFDPVQDRLLKRIITVNDSGFGVPGPGVIPGSALRPEFQKVFAEAGGVSGIDVKDLTPEEERGLMFMLDPSWVKAQSGGA